MESRVTPGSRMLDAQKRLQDVEAVFAALAHASRRHILLVIHFRGGVMSAGDIAARFQHAWPTISRHLKVLEEAGLLTHEKQGRTRIYRVDRDRLQVLQDWLQWFEEEEADLEPQEPNPKNS